MEFFEFYTPLPREILAFLGFIVGACLGSFLGAALYRLPRGLSIVHPPSSCTACQRRLKPLELVPILSFLWQRGRCGCGEQKLSPHYMLAELLLALVGALIGFAIG